MPNSRVTSVQRMSGVVLVHKLFQIIGLHVLTLITCLCERIIYRFKCV